MEKYNEYLNKVLNEEKEDDKKLKIKAIYDNGGKTADRYTVYYNSVASRKDGEVFYDCLVMSGDPFHPQGIGQHSSGMLGNHNGKRIKFEQLPKDCQRAVERDL